MQDNPEGPPQTLPTDKKSSDEKPLGENPNVIIARALNKLNVTPRDRPNFTAMQDFKDWIEEKAGEDLNPLKQAMRYDHDDEPDHTLIIDDAFLSCPNNSLQSAVNNLAIMLRNTPLKQDDLTVYPDRSSFFQSPKSAERFEQFQKGLANILSVDNVNNVFNHKDTTSYSNPRLNHRARRRRAYLEAILGTVGITKLTSAGFGGIAQAADMKTFNPTSHTEAINVISPIIGRSTSR